MGTYKAFSGTKSKLAKVWEQNQENEARIDESIKTIDTSFLSANDFKRPITLTILNNYLDPDSSSYGIEYSVNLTGFPDWAISNSHLLITLATWDTKTANTATFDIAKAKNNFMEAINNGTLKDGDYTLESLNYNCFWTKLKDGYKFTFRPYIYVYLAKNQGGNNWSGSPIPLWFTVKLSLSNEKNFNAIQSGK